MSKKSEPARTHLLPEKSASKVVIIRRKPSNLFHILLWNTRKNTLDAGSWFNGKLYPMRYDVSPDGNCMVYSAMGSYGETWNEVCIVPWLKTIAESNNMELRYDKLLKQVDAQSQRANLLFVTDFCNSTRIRRKSCLTSSRRF